jgi:hypothetical protein
MQGRNARLEGGQELTYVTHKDALHGSLLARIIEAVNTLAKNANVSAVGKLPPPAPVNGIQVQGSQAGNVITAPSEHLHFVITHNAELDKGARYISEIATEPNFLQPHIVDHGCSRTGFVHLPTMYNDGKVQTYYLRSMVQYRGSDASKPTVLGGLAGATQIQMTGTSKSSLLPSTGSGTASPTGMQGGKGLGDVITRPAPGPKRSL